MHPEQEALAGVGADAFLAKPVQLSELADALSGRAIVQASE